MFPSFFHEQRRKCTSSLELSFNTSLPLLTSSGDATCTSHCPTIASPHVRTPADMGQNESKINSRYIQILYPRNWMVDPKHKNASVLVAWGWNFDICPPYRFHIFRFARRSEQPDPTSTALTASSGTPATCWVAGCVKMKHTQAWHVSTKNFSFWINSGEFGFGCPQNFAKAKVGGSK